MNLEIENILFNFLFLNSKKQFSTLQKLNTYIIITAGGVGNRMNSATPKQFLILKNKPILFHTINAFNEFNKSLKIIVTLPEKEIETWNELCKNYNFNIEHTVVKGGLSRFHSVKNAINIIKDADIIGVHDGVRPFVSKKIIGELFENAEKYGCSIPVIAPNESIRKIEIDKNIAVNRSEYRMVQTPQCFKAEILKEAYKQEFSENFTDDASVVEKLGYKIHLSVGDIKNIKITTPFDLLIGEALLCE